MNTRFGGFSPASAKRQRMRLVVVIGSTVAFALFAIGTALLMNQKDGVASGTQQISDASLRERAFESVVLIAPTAPVQKGMNLSQVKLREIHWPRNEVPEGAIRDFNVLNGMYARVELPANYPVLRANLSSTPITSVMAEMIPPGHRAVTIQVDATSGVEGWARAGAHVDVNVTYRVLPENISRTTTVVQDAVILSYNGRIEPRFNVQEVGQMPQSATVTLAVTPIDGLKIQNAQQTGRITLMLRRSDDAMGLSDDISVTPEDFDRRERENARPHRQARSNIKGFFSFKNQDGVQENFELTPDNSWYKVDEDLDSDF